MGRLLQRNLQPSLFFHFLFSCISSLFSPIISISFQILYIHLVLDLSLGLFPPFLCVAFPQLFSLRSFISSFQTILICSVNVIFLICSTLSSYRMLVFVIQSFYVLFKTAFKKLPRLEFCFLNEAILSFCCLTFLLNIVTFT